MVLSSLFRKKSFYLPTEENTRSLARDFASLMPRPPEKKLKAVGLVGPIKRQPEHVGKTVFASEVVNELKRDYPVCHTFKKSSGQERKVFSDKSERYWLCHHDLKDLWSLAFLEGRPAESYIGQSFRSNYPYGIDLIEHPYEEDDFWERDRKYDYILEFRKAKKGIYLTISPSREEAQRPKYKDFLERNKEFELV